MSEEQVGWYDFVEYGMNPRARMNDPDEVKFPEMGVIGSVYFISQDVADKWVRKMYPRRTVVARFAGDKAARAAAKEGTE